MAGARGPPPVAQGRRTGDGETIPWKIAGGAKSLASPEHESDREFVLAQIRKSIRLHGAEREHHHGEMERAVATLRAAIPGVRVEGYFVDFEGVWGWAAKIGAG
jgi:hypothetical protein